MVVEGSLSRVEDEDLCAGGPTFNRFALKKAQASISGFATKATTSAAQYI